MKGIARIGIDIGGTFTDTASIDGRGELRIGKRLTTHGSEQEGTVSAVIDSGVDATDPRTILAHGTTLVINALVERHGSRTALVTTEGFRDVIEIGRGNRPETYNLHFRRDPPLIPADLRFEVRERVHADGTVMRVPSRRALVALTKALRTAGVEAVAVGLLNSYVEPANERLIGRWLQQTLPGVAVTLSSELSREWREYERFMTAAANAYVQPVAERYVRQLVDSLEQKCGFAGEFIMLDSNGGGIGAETLRRMPIRMVESGPAAGVISALDLALRLNLDNVVTFDMGGTTAKSCLVVDGNYASTDLYWIGGYAHGFPLQVPTVEIIEVGAGGGSIAWRDGTGRLRVGPRSAGSSPGPACYGLGGTETTVTDANLYCGRMAPEHFARSIQLDPAAATTAIGSLAGTMGMSERRTALGILTLANLAMAGSVRKLTLERGRDPHDFTLIAFGGAGPMHACDVAVEAGIRSVLVPPYPGHFSALGMLAADLRLERREVLVGALAELDLGRLSQTLERIANELRVELSWQHLGEAETHVSYSTDLRYRGQEHGLRVPAPNAGLAVSNELIPMVKAAFESEYARRYGHRDESAIIETVAVTVTATRALPRQPFPNAAPPAVLRDGIANSLFALSEEPQSTPVIARSAIRPATELRGPAILHEEGATTVIPPGATATIAADGRSLLIDVSDLVEARMGR